MPPGLLKRGSFRKHGTEVSILVMVMDYRDLNENKEDQEMKRIVLEFDGYWLEAGKAGIPSVSGVYCVYSCVYNKGKKDLSIKRLLYIGESKNVHERIANHDRLDDWLSYLEEDQTLCYSYAKISNTDRERAEAALIFEVQPPFNDEHTKDFIYNDTEIITSGKNYLLPKDIYVKGESER